VILLIPIAFRNLRRNLRRTLLTALAITLGVYIITMMRGMVNAFQGRIIENITDARTGHVQVHRAGYLASTEAVPLDLNFETALAERVRAVAGVEAAAARIAFAGMINNGETSVMFLGNGMDPVNEPRVTPLAAEDALEGGTLDPSRKDGVLVGQGLATALKLKVGSSVTLLCNTVHGSINAVDATVIGIVQSRLPFENKKLVIAPLALAQEVLQMEGRATELAVRAQGRLTPDALKASIALALGEGYEVHTWLEVMAFFSALMALQNFLMAFVQFMLFTVVLVAIVNTMMMTVFERTREIGTMMAIGLRRRKVLALFLLESASLGLLGGLVGASVGYTVVNLVGRRGISLPVPGIERPTAFYPYATLAFTAFAVALAVAGATLSALWPAWKGSRLNPVDALRAN
jgi:putative ABC transport system permease protein